MQKERFNYDCKSLPEFLLKFIKIRIRSLKIIQIQFNFQNYLGLNRYLFDV